MTWTPGLVLLLGIVVGVLIILLLLMSGTLHA